jgi:hypothetical protein
MLLRVCLILAIVAGLGVIGVSQFMLRPQIETIIAEREHNKTEWNKTSAELTKTKKTLKDTSEKLASTEKSLEETKGQLASTTSKFEAEQKKSAGLQQNVEKLRADLKAASDDLAAWTNLGLRVEQVKSVIDELKAAQLSNEGLKEENKVFQAEVKKKQAELDAIRGKDEDPFVPRDVRGKVLVVDPKWDFLVLDVGAKVGVPKKGVLLVSRNGELVAKVRVMTVEDQRSIANIMPGWKLRDIIEGDVVLAY